MNLNDLAKVLTQREGKLESVSIAQVKEVMKLVFQELAKMDIWQIGSILKKYKNDK